MPETISTPGLKPRPLPGEKKRENTPRTITVVDALGGAVTETGRFPHPLREDGGGITLAGVSFVDDGGDVSMTPLRAETDPIVNGASLTEPVTLPVNETLTLRIADKLYFVRCSAETGWPSGFDKDDWKLFDAATGELLGQSAPEHLPALAEKLKSDPARCAVCPAGLDTGFMLDGILKVLRKRASHAPRSSLADAGRHFCPACWFHFESGDALNIATHESLMGDPVLGPDHRLRFHPTRFTDAGVALDPMDQPAPDLACPHCRRRLPHGFLDTEHRVLSIVGAPGAGKSYFLAVLTRLLQDGLHRDFGLTFRDDDPTGNMLLNQMRNRLFSALCAEDAVLGKTAFEGAFYERITRAGRTVALPRPFVYSIAAPEGATASMVFYDNAGEHFEPGVDPEDSPGALHVTRSAGLFFLFDPTGSAGFRSRLIGHSDDPQLRQGGRIDQQDTILFEMDVRIKRILGMRRESRIATPLAVLIGKCDVWSRLFDTSWLDNPVVDGGLDSARIDENSELLRSLLLQLCPALVTGAESISSDVRYFAVSALGHSPAPIVGGPKAGQLAPDPAKLAPYGIDHAAYWVISRAFPGVIPTT